MRATRAVALTGVALAAALATATGAAAEPPEPGAYRDNDFSGGTAFNIVPPGQNGLTTASGAAAFLLGGTRPPHQADQNDMYANLVYRAPGLKRSEILDFYKDASFGVPEGEGTITNPVCAVAIPPSPGSARCDEVTIVRDGFGVPHVYGANRAALMFGLGYANGMDRLFLADALRHAGRGQLSSFAGGGAGNRAQDADTFASAPYKDESEYQTQYDQADDIYGADGVQVQRDVQSYVDGMNQWIAETKVDPANKLDALYAATNNVGGPAPWKVTDVIATGALVAGIFGKGGGGELGAATALQDAQRVLGRRQGKQVWKDFRSADDPEAPSTVRGKRFPYRVPRSRRGLAMPDPGSLVRVPTVKETSAPSESSAEGGSEDGVPALGDLLRPLREVDGASNALLVSARESKGGKPIAVFGPQTGYLAPQLLTEQDAHAPATAEHGPAIHARGVSFVGTNLYVQLGRGVDYAFSATSAGQDIIDTFAVNLCEPGGGEPTIDSMGYRWDGRCLPIEVLERTNSWLPSAADQSPPGSETLQAFRTAAGLVTHRATIDGKPVAYTSLRATYRREVDAAASFADWNSPDVIKGPRSWMRAGLKNDLTFNWFYIDNKRIAYYNSGANPVRAPGTHPNFPVMAKQKLRWRDHNATLNTFRRAPLRKRPHVIDQRFLTSWNNKQAPGYRCDGIRCYTSVYRSMPLDERIKREIKGKRKMSLVDLINAMEDAGTVDLRGVADLPWALRVIRSGGRKPSGALAQAVRRLAAWQRAGAHRRDHDNDGTYDHAEAVKIIDAWWPRWVDGQFRPVLGDELVDVFVRGIHDAPGAAGSAFNGVFYGFVEKDLRSLLGRPVRGAYSRTYCGRGRLAACRKMLSRTLRQAARTSPEELYGNEGCALNNGTEASPQMCHDAVNASDVTVAGVGPFHWINRPTFQQAVQFQSGRR